MFQQTHNPQGRQLTRGLTFATAAALTILALGIGTVPAAARQDAGPTDVRVGQACECFLERVGTQYVRCDDSTGNGVPAPAWVRER